MEKIILKPGETIIHNDGDGAVVAFSAKCGSVHIEYLGPHSARLTAAAKLAGEPFGFSSTYVGPGGSGGGPARRAICIPACK